jgi:hypothetical protein
MWSERTLINIRKVQMDYQKRNIKRKIVATPVDKIDGYRLSDNTVIIFNANTNKVMVYNNFTYNRQTISLTTHERYDYTNPEVLEKLSKRQTANANKYSKRRREAALDALFPLKDFSEIDYSKLSNKIQESFNDK